MEVASVLHQHALHQHAQIDELGKTNKEEKLLAWIAALDECSHVKGDGDAMEGNTIQVWIGGARYVYCWESV
jgi:hypothetical protein